MSSTAPSPIAWTLRLKYKKSTILLHVNPLEKFSSIKSTLFRALQETHLQDPATGNDVQLPETAEQIVFGRPVDINDPSKGFQLGEWENRADLEDDLETADKKKGKGRPKKSADAEDELVTNGEIGQCPKGAGLRDNAVLAFRWGLAREEGDDDIEMEEEEDDWNVTLPSYEDAYGVENTGDVGGRPQFEG